MKFFIIALFVVVGVFFTILFEAQYQNATDDNHNINRTEFFLKYGLDYYINTQEEDCE